MSRPLRFALVILMLLVSEVPFSAVRAQVATPVATPGIVEDVSGLFFAPIPTNWSTTTSDSFIELSSPDGDLIVYLLVVDATSVTAAADTVLALMDGEVKPETTPEANQSTPSAEGVDETAVITYLKDGGEGFVQLYGQRIGDQVYCIVFSGTVEAATKRDSQIQQIATGFTIKSLTKQDLTASIPGEWTPELQADLEAYISALLIRLEVPGASVSIVIGDEIVYSGGFGVKTIGESDPVDADTMMMIGSTTKSMTTMMMATEVDDGLLDWDQPVIEVYPSFAVADPELTKTMTVRNLVCACTGVPRRDLEFLFNANDLTPNDVIASLAEFEFFTGFGEAFQYSNQMVATGGYVAAAAASDPDADLMAEYIVEMQARVFDPIGMTRTTLSFDLVEADDNYATPHGVNMAAEYVAIPLSYEQVLVPVAPAGLVWSTVNDMGRYLITEIGEGVGPDGNRVVSRKNLEETWMPQVAVDGKTSYGLGWFVGEYKGLPLLNHGGNTLGFTSDLAFLPDQGIGIATLANGQGSNIFNEGIRTYFFELIYDLPHEYDTQINYFLDEAETGYAAIIDQLEILPAGIAESAVGTYESDVLGVLSLSMVGDVLVLDTGEFQSRLLLQKGSDTENSAVLVAADPPIPGTPFSLSISDSGERTVELIFGTDTYTFEEISPFATPISATPVAT